MKGTKIPEIELDLLRQLWPTAKTVAEIREAFPHRDIRVLQNAASRLGLKAYQRRRRGDLTYLLGDNLQVCYWLGFIMADGSISRDGHLQIMVNEKDQDHLQLLGDALGTTAKHAYTDPNKNYVKHASFHTDASIRQLVKLAVMHKGIATRVLARVGYDSTNTPKTYHSPHRSALEAFTIDQFIAFFIGFMDGDGCKRITGMTAENHLSAVDFFLFCKDRQLFDRVTPKPKTVVGAVHQPTYLRLCNFIREHDLVVMKRKWPDV